MPNLSIVLIAAISLLGTVNGALAGPIAPLKVYYPFSGNGADASGNGNDGTVIGAGLTTDRFGHPKSAYHFDGVDDYIDLPSLYSYSPAQVTINAWVNLDSIGTRQMITIKATGLDTPGNFALEIADSGHIRWQGNNGGWWAVMGTTLLQTDTWYQITAVQDGGTSRVFLNGVEDGSGTNAGIAAGTIPWMIGQHPWYQGGFVPGFGFDGTIDDVRIYDGALTGEQIQALYVEPAPVPEPGSLFLLGTGIAAVVLARWRDRRR
jgi:hypothetical protein